MQLVGKNEQFKIMDNKLQEYIQLLKLEPTNISSNCDSLNATYQKLQEATHFLSTFNLEQMNETIQNIGQLKEISNNIEEVTINAINLIANENKKKQEEILNQQEEQLAQINSKIKQNENSSQKLKSNKQDLNAVILALNSQLKNNLKKFQEINRTNSTKEERLTEINLKFKILENEKNNNNNTNNIQQFSEQQNQIQEEINAINQESQAEHQAYLIIQEQNFEINKSLIEKKKELTEIDQEIKKFNTELQQAKFNQEELLKNIKQTKENLNNLQLDETLKNYTSKLAQLNEQVREKQEEMEEATQENEKERISFELEQVQKDILEIENLIESVKLDLKFKRKFQDSKQSFLQQKWLKFNIISPTSNKLANAKKVSGKVLKLIEKLKDQKEAKKEKCMKLQNEIKKINSKLVQTNNIVENYKLKAELKTLSKLQEEAWENYIGTIKQLNKQKKILMNQKTQQVLLLKSVKSSIKPPKVLKANKRVPVKSKASRKEAYPVPDFNGKGKIVKTKLSLKVDTKEEISRRQKRVQGIEELIVKYEQFIVLKEKLLQKQLRIVERRETVVGKQEQQVKNAKENIKKAVAKCKREKREILQSAKEIRQSKEYKKKERDLTRRVNELAGQLKQEFKREKLIQQKKKKLEQKEKKLEEIQEKLDQKVEEIEKQIFNNAQQKKKLKLIQLSSNNSSYQEHNFLQDGQQIKLTSKNEKKEETENEKNEENQIESYSFIEINVERKNNLYEKNQELFKQYEILKFFNETIEKKMRENEDGTSYLLENSQKLSKQLLKVLSTMKENGEGKSLLRVYQLKQEINRLNTIANSQRILKYKEEIIIEKNKALLLLLQSVCLE